MNLLTPSRLADHPRLRRRLSKRLRRKAPTPAELEHIEAGRQPPRPPSPTWLWALAAVGGLGLLQLGMAGVDAVSGESLGEACTEHRDCESGLCLKHLRRDARYCSTPCDGAGDCGPTLDCGPAEALPEAQRGVGAAGPLAQGAVCIRQ